MHSATLAHRSKKLLKVFMRLCVREMMVWVENRHFLAEYIQHLTYLQCRQKFYLVAFSLK